MTINIKFEGIDDWNRPVFKCVDEKYKSIRFGSTNKLFNWNTPEKEIIDYFKSTTVDALEYFGHSFGCEPNGGILKGLVLNIIE